MQTRSEIQRRYYQKNWKTIQAKIKEWGKTNPEKRAFYRQRSQAKQRGIDFLLTLEEWLEWWGDDLPRRGRGKGKLVMCRHDDVGAYELGNIYKAENADNVRHYYETD